jgi:hypothetical protein
MVGVLEVVFGAGLQHITRYSRHLEDDECGWDASGIPERYMTCGES